MNETEATTAGVFSRFNCLIYQVCSAPSHTKYSLEFWVCAAFSEYPFEWLKMNQQTTFKAHLCFPKSVLGGIHDKILGLYWDYSKMEDVSRMHCFPLRKTRATTKQAVLILSWLITGSESHTDCLLPSHATHLRSKGHYSVHLLDTHSPQGKF